jgi:hypothetical protein
MRDPIVEEIRKYRAGPAPRHCLTNAGNAGELRKSSAAFVKQWHGSSNSAVLLPVADMRIKWYNRDMASPDKPQSPRVDVREYRGQTVALDPQTFQIVGHGTLQEAEAQARGRGIERPILWPVRESEGYFIGGRGR